MKQAGRHARESDNYEVYNCDNVANVKRYLPAPEVTSYGPAVEDGSNTEEPEDFFAME